MNSNFSPQLPEIPGSQGIFHQTALRIKLFLRMLKDPRISLFLKAMPILSVLYLISPLDFAPLMPLDDAAILTLAFYLFIELSPKEVTDEIMEDLRNLDAKKSGFSTQSDEIIEGTLIQTGSSSLNTGESLQEEKQDS